MKIEIEPTGTIQEAIEGGPMSAHEPLVDLVCCECQQPFKAEQHHRVCPFCVEAHMADYDDNYQDEECGQCGGEGYVSNCFEEYACIDPEGGCDFCTSRCDWCNQRTPAQQKQPDELSAVLGDALAAESTKK